MSGLMLSLAAAAAMAQSVITVPQWQTDYATALRAAQQAQRPLLVVLENPTNPSQAVGKEVLASVQGRPELLDEFEWCRIDVSTKTGKLVADAFGAKQLPYTAITDQKCKKIVDTHVGRPTARRWVAMLTARVPRGNQGGLLLHDRGLLSPIGGLLSPENCFT